MSKTFCPRFVFFSQRIANTPYAAYVYLESDEEESSFLTFALMRDSSEEPEVVDFTSFPVKVENCFFRSIEENRLAIAGNSEVGLLFQRESASAAEWKMAVSYSTEFGVSTQEEIPVMINLQWAAF